MLVSNPPPPLQWVHYLNPIAWCVQAFAISEFTSPGWQIPEANGVEGLTQGEYALAAFGLRRDR